MIFTRVTCLRLGLWDDRIVAGLDYFTAARGQTATDST